MIIIILLVYVIGCGMAILLIDLTESITGIRFTNSDIIKLSLFSWYSCIVLNDMINKWYD